MSGPTDGPEVTPPQPLVRPLVGAVLFYLALGVFLTASVWSDPTNRWIGGCCDPEQSIWFLAWLPTAIQHGQNPLLTDRLNAPDGANLMWNASVPLLALLVSPVTTAFGPILAYNVAALAAIVASGLAAFFALRRFTSRPLGPLVGGGLYAVSPYVASHTVLHLNLINAWAPPLFLILIDELLVRRRRRPEVVGLGLGIVGALQLLTSEEMLATSAVAAVVLVLVIALVVRDRNAITGAATRIARSIGPGLVGFFVIGGVPLAVQFLGPQQIHGRVQDTAVFSTDLLNLVLPTSYQLMAPEAWTAVSRHFSGLFHEATGYVGAPLLLVLGWIVFELRSDRRAIVAAAMAVTMFVLSLGPQLNVGGQPTGIPMPWLPIGSLPLLEHALPVRLTLYMWLAVAVLVALGIDRAAGAPGEAGISMRAAGTLRRAAARLAIVGVALVFVLPAPMRSSTASIPELFRSWDRAGIGSDEVILFAPWFANGAGADPMLWAAVAAARPKMYEGYVYVPGPDGRPQYGPAPRQLSQLMTRIQDDGVSLVARGEVRAAALQELVDREISVVIVGPMQYRDQMVAMFTDLLGRPPVDTDGVQIWRDVPSLLAQPAAAEG